MHSATTNPKTDHRHPPDRDRAQDHGPLPVDPRVTHPTSAPSAAPPIEAPGEQPPRLFGVWANQVCESSGLAWGHPISGDDVHHKVVGSAGCIAEEREAIADTPPRPAGSGRRRPAAAGRPGRHPRPGTRTRST